ncbi:MAG TPA: multicopper oxidase family protein [Bryobacteraceae bacterium]|nr:multicopper oxidase family protein [Bryobacteraceae bacterium]
MFEPSESLSTASSSLTRRKIVSLLGSGLTAAAVSRIARADEPKPDITLRIQEYTLDLAPRRAVKTIAYNGQVPGPLLRAKEGQPVMIEVFNETNDDELVHWHGLHIPSDVDGAHEEGTPHVPRHSSRRYTFTPNPAGTRWYHSHFSSGRNLHSGTYSGQFGLLIVEAASDPAGYDQDVPIILHDWEPAFSKEGPLGVEYKFGSINGKSLGAGEPIRVKPSQRVLFRILNASATDQHRLALTGHRFKIVALDGNPVSQGIPVAAIDVAPGERVDAIVEMNNPGVWVFGEVRDRDRNQGTGIVVEYANQQGAPRWLPPPAVPWDYTAFGGRDAAPEPDGRFPLVFKAAENGHHFTINGKAYPHTDPMIVKADRRYRMIFDNQSADPHPVHLHRHTWEITKYDKTPTSGVRKDVVVVPAWKEVEADFIASNPGLTLFHCHQQFHMDFGFMAMVQYAG